MQRMIIDYIALFLILVSLIDGVLGDYIVYMLKCRKGYIVIGKVIDLDYIHLKFDRSGTYVSVFEYVIGGNKKLAVLTSYPDDKIGDEVLLYINGSYIVRNKISFKGKRLVTVFAAAWAGVIIHDIVIQWSGMLDIMAVIIECCLLVIFVLYSPILYKNHITDIKKHLGWHLNL